MSMPNLQAVNDQEENQQSNLQPTNITPPVAGLTHPALPLQLVQNPLMQIYKPEIFELLETKIANPLADNVAAKISLGRMHREDGNSYKGGIWISCDASRTILDIVHTSDQVVHALMQVNNSFSSFLYTTLYASPIKLMRNKLWDSLSNLGSNLNMPWLLAGGF